MLHYLAIGGEVLAFKMPKQVGQEGPMPPVRRVCLVLPLRQACHMCMKPPTDALPSAGCQKLGLNTKGWGLTKPPDQLPVGLLGDVHGGGA